MVLHINTFSKKSCANKFLKTKIARIIVHVFNLVEEFVFATNRVHEIRGPQCHVFKIICEITV